MQGQHRPICAQRLNRDIAELFTYDFNCSSSAITVKQTSDSWNVPGNIVLCISILEGPYRGGVFSFSLGIPENYPFKIVNVWSCHPIWHPNIQLTSGRVALPIEWTPVITLRTIAMSVQMLMLEPSSDNPLNLEAYSHYMRGTEVFDLYVQKSLRGGSNIMDGIVFPCVLNNSASLTRKRNSDCSPELVSSSKKAVQWSPTAAAQSSPRKRHFRDVEVDPCCEELLEVDENNENSEMVMGGFSPPQNSIFGSHSNKFSMLSCESLQRMSSHSPINSELCKMSLSSADNNSLTYNSNSYNSGGRLEDFHFDKRRKT